MPRVLAGAMVMAPLLTPLLRLSAVRSWLDRVVAHFVTGPSVRQRADDWVEFGAELRDERGARRSGRVHTPNAYELTVQAALAAVARVDLNRRDRASYNGSGGSNVHI